MIRACQFGEAMHDPEVQAASRTPDRPWSLFKGQAGGLAFLAALAADEPSMARFPFFECDSPSTPLDQSGSIDSPRA